MATPELSTRKITGDVFVVMYGNVRSNMWIWRDEDGQWRLSRKDERGRFNTLAEVEACSQGLLAAQRFLDLSGHGVEAGTGTMGTPFTNA
jgi:hypothetical protein